MTLPPLDAAAQAWVSRTRATLDTGAAIAQLFNFAVRDMGNAELDALLSTGAGGFHRFPGSDLGIADAVTRRLIDESAIAPLISGDIEGGGTSFGFATPFPNQLALAACNDLELTAEVARMVAVETRAAGFNWAFAPVVDVNAAFRSTIVGTRSFGADPDKVLAHARTYVATLQAHGIAATAKHWPGEGYDDRDQHLLTTVNPLEMDVWWAVFGKIYATLIDDGLMTIMAGHISLPAYHRNSERDAFVPASLSRALNIDLLREELGFTGLLVSDATVMAGMATRLDRAVAVPTVIENGCDMFLFSRDPAADIAHMTAGLKAGILSEQRLDEAVTRILTLKARLGLHAPAVAAPLAERARSLQAPAHCRVAARAAQASLTLVKDVQNLLPLDPAIHRRVVIIDAKDDARFIDGAPPKSFAPLIEALEELGFEVRAYDPDCPPRRADTDLLLYLVGDESTPVVATNRLDWVALHGGPRKAMVRFWHEIPTAMISFGYPFLLYCAPDVPTYINAYCAIGQVQRAVAHALTQRGAFPGTSPVDPFCGRPETRL